MNKKDLQDRLDSIKKTVIISLLYNPLKDFLRNYPDEVYDGLSAQFLLNLGSPSKAFSKNDLIDFCIRCFSIKELVKGFYEAQSPIWKAIVEKAFWVRSIDRKDLKEILGKDPIVPKVNRYSNWRNQGFTITAELTDFSDCINLLTPYNLWDYETGKMRSEFDLTDVSLSLPQAFREIFRDFVAQPKGYDLQPIERPAGSHLTFFDAEDTILYELPLILSYYFQGNLKFSSKSVPSRPSSRKMGRQLHLKEFANGDFIRSHLIAGFLADDLQKERGSVAVENTIKALFERELGYPPLAYYLLPHVKGLSQLRSYDILEEGTDAFFAFITSQKIEGWITAENLQSYFKYRFVNLSPLNSRVFYDVRVVNETGGDIRITDENSDQLLTRTFLWGHLYLLAAFGLLELAIDVNAPLGTPYEGLYAFRMTELGRFVFGKINHYTPKVSAPKVKLNLDENNPVILVEGDTTLGETLLSNFVEKVSDIRFVFSPGYFLKDCKRRENLIHKITLFRQVINAPLPQNWEQYLRTLVKNADPLAQDWSVTVYSLPSDNKELIQLIARDPILKKIIIKAEQFKILIQPADHGTFIKRMRALGYFME